MRRTRKPLFTIITPARNAAPTLAETLDSVAAQTLRRWEAIVVDDGSTDATGDIAAGYAARDKRFVVVRGPAHGQSAARNVAIERARADWLVFLDADDLLEPEALRLFHFAIAADPTLDAAAGGWVRITEDGRFLDSYPWDWPYDVFERVAMYCLFPLHTCVLRKRLVQEAGSFDTRFNSAPDWDMWLRVFRAGARIGTIPDVVGRYRMVRGAVSTNAQKVFDEGVAVLSISHAADPRLRSPVPALVRGRHPERRTAAAIRYACWVAGILIAGGEDPLPPLHGIAPYAPSAPGEVLAYEDDLDPEIIGLALTTSIRNVRMLSMSEWGKGDVWPELASPVDAFLAELERVTSIPGLSWRARLLLRPAGSPPSIDGSCLGLDVELTEPVPDVEMAGGCNRLVVVGRLEGEPLGLIELPVWDGGVSPSILRDAVSERWSWQMLLRFLERRGDTRPDEGIGRVWGVLMRELWCERRGDVARAGDGPLELELGDCVPELFVDAPSTNIVLKVGGVPVDAVRLDGPAHLPRSAVREALWGAFGAELLLAAAREGILGRDLDGAASLRDAIRSARAANSASTGVVIGRRVVGAAGTSVSRRAALPASCAAEAVASARAAAEPVVVEGEPVIEGGGDRTVDYVPGVLGRVAISSDYQAPIPEAFRYDRYAFEALFAARTDPWPELAWLDEPILELLAGAHRVLEVGCAEGRLTARLARVAGEIVALDISRIALDRARRACGGLPNASFVQGDALRDALPAESFDAILCAEVLCYAGDEFALRDVAGGLAARLTPGGIVVAAHALVRSDPACPWYSCAVPGGARDVERAFKRAGLAPLHEVRTPSHVVHVFGRSSARGRTTIRRFPGPAVEPPVHASSARAVITEVLPILRYAEPVGDLADHLDLLAGGGFRTITLDAWAAGVRRRQPLPGRAAIVALDGPAGWIRTAWRTVRERGFRAIVVLEVDRIGSDGFLDWTEVAAMCGRGAAIAVKLGCRTQSDDERLVGEAIRARTAVTEATGRPPTTFFRGGRVDAALRRALGGAGYVYGLSQRDGPARIRESLLSLPTIDVRPDDTFDGFVRKLMWV